MDLDRRQKAAIAILISIAIVMGASIYFLVGAGHTASISLSATSGTAPLAITATCAEGSGSWTPPTQYTMNWGDGSAANTASSSNDFATFSHTYSSGGIFTATCNIEDSIADQASASQSVTVSASSTTTTAQTTSTISTTSTTSTTYSPVTVSISASPTSGTAPLTVSFTASASGGSHSGYSYAWNFGDSTTGSGSSITHSYGTAGTYSVVVTVTDSVGHTGQSSIIIGVTAPATTTSSTATEATLTASISASPLTGNAPLAVSFNALPSGGSNSYLCSWTFGDGQGLGSGCSGTHQYASAGSYLLQLTVTDSQGHTAQSSVAIQVTSTTSTTTQSILTSSSVSGGTTITSVQGGTTVTTTSNGVLLTTVNGGVTMTSVSGGTTYVFTLTQTSIETNQPEILAPNWATGNISVGSDDVQAPIYLSSNLNVSSIAASAQISHVSYNQTVLQLQFAQSGPVTVTMLESNAPVAVYADNQAISTWTFSNGVLSITADPSTLTVIFSQIGITTPTSTTGLILIALVLVIIAFVAIGSIYAIRRR